MRLERLCDIAQRINTPSCGDLMEWSKVCLKKLVGPFSRLRFLFAVQVEQNWAQHALASRGASSKPSPWQSNMLCQGVLQHAGVVEANAGEIFVLWELRQLWLKLTNLRSIPSTTTPWVPSWTAWRRSTRGVCVGQWCRVWGWSQIKHHWEAFSLGWQDHWNCFQGESNDSNLVGQSVFEGQEHDIEGTHLLFNYFPWFPARAGRWICEGKQQQGHAVWKHQQLLWRRRHTSTSPPFERRCSSEVEIKTYEERWCFDGIGGEEQGKDCDKDWHPSHLCFGQQSDWEQDCNMPSEDEFRWDEDGGSCC